MNKSRVEEKCPEHALAELLSTTMALFVPTAKRWLKKQKRLAMRGWRDSSTYTSPTNGLLEVETLKNLLIAK
jgi:hypothetical protein